MNKSQVQSNPIPIRAVVELSNESHIVLPEDMTLFLVQWMKSLTANGFSNVRIKSERLNHEIRIEMEAGSILRGKIAIHQADSIERALFRHEAGV